MEQSIACPHCGAQLKPTAKFCEKCGNPVTIATTQPPTPPPPEYSTPRKSSPIPLLIGLGLGLCFLCSIIGIGAFAFFTLANQPTPTPVIALQPTPLPTRVTPLASPTALLQPTLAALSVVINGVTARDAKSDNFDPIGITDTFDANQAVFHVIITIANAPKDTPFKIVWTAVDIGNVAAPNTVIGEYELKSEGSRNLDFTFKPDAGRLPAGKYKAEIFVNGKFDRALNFVVAGASAQPSPAAKVTTAPTSVAKPTTAPVAKPSGFVKNVVLAEDAQGANKDPINPTTTFKPKSVFHAVVQTDKAPANTKFAAMWYAIDVGSAAAPNSLIDTTELSTDGTRNIDFSLSPASQWPLGSYRVEIYVNGTLDTIKTFSVK